MNQAVLLSEKTPERLVLISLFFSLLNFFGHGLNGQSILVFLAFTASVFIVVKLFMLVQKLDAQGLDGLDELKGWLTAAAVLFIGIATFTCSWMFGTFFACVVAVYFISPYDRAWLAGKAEIVVHDNKVEYRQV